MEMKLENTAFVRVDSDTADKLINKDEKPVSLLNTEQEDAIKKIAEQTVPAEQYSVVLEPMQPTDAPVTITRPEFMRRMKEMASVGGGYDFMGGMKENFNVIVNTNHPLMSRILGETDASAQANKMKQAVDLALLSQGLLKGEDLSKFIKKSLDMLSSDM
jgi:molecular chaperone HtpG